MDTEYINFFNFVKRPHHTLTGIGEDSLTVINLNEGFMEELRADYNFDEESTREYMKNVGYYLRRS